jgi:formylglycine-generating enzyme required for sulfatase activity
MLLLALPAPAVTIDWVTVGDPGNPADTQVMNDGTSGYGSVPYVYRIAKHEVTNTQYAAFLNAVAASDPNGLYAAGMSCCFGGITRSGSDGSYSYGLIAGRENLPVNVVSFYDALRFTNWLHNGQPSGAQDATTTEDGAYTITAQGIGDNSITRNAHATIFLPNEDEWYKAAYYDAGLGTYYAYPAGSDSVIGCAAPGLAPNTANCTNTDDHAEFPTPVGAYPNSASPYGTYDQGGNVWEWNEAIGGAGDALRGQRGGGFQNNGPSRTAAFNRAFNDTGAGGQAGTLGFRIAMIPEPSTALLFAAGLLVIARRTPR